MLPYSSHDNIIKQKATFVPDNPSYKWTSENTKTGMVLNLSLVATWCKQLDYG